MFTILIPVLKSGYLKSQLYWLSNQTYKNFSVIVMDVDYKYNRYQPWIDKKYPFQFYHVPLIHNVMQHKRFDFSVKNNLALLSPTNYFVFLSDTHYIKNNFCEEVFNEIVKNESDCTLFTASTLLYNAYFADSNYVDLGGETTHLAKPAILFNSKLFFYVLNGFDEVTNYSHGYENMLVRLYSLKDIKNKNNLNKKNGLVYHILHENHDNVFGDNWRKPCEKCSCIFAEWKFDMERDGNDFPLTGEDIDIINQMIFIDSDLGVKMFQCPNCGFCGTIESTKLDDLMLSNKILSAPVKGFDGDVGRDLINIYETMCKQVNNRINSKIAYLKTTY